MEEQLAEALSRLAELERKVADQDAELQTLRTAQTTRPVSAPNTDAAPPADVRPDRRTMLRHAGIALAGAASAGAILEVASASPAAAVDTPFLLNVSNQANAETKIDYIGSTIPSNMLTVANGSTSGVTGAAIAGVAADETDADHGVVGVTDSTSGSGYGVIGRGRGQGTIGVRAEGDRAALKLVPSSGDPRTSIGTHGAGEVYQDLQDNTWVCVTSGSPGKWRQLAGPATTGALHMLDIPKRVYDSRNGFDPTDVPKGKLNNGDERVIDARHGDAFPPGVLAVMINLVATGTNGGGWLAAFKNGITFPGTSTLNWSAPNSIIANGATVAVDINDKFKVLCAGSCDFAVDVIGYYY